MGFLLPSAALQQTAVVFVRRHAVRREELVDGEVDAAEHRARIVLGRALARFVRHAVVVGRDEQLRVALEPDDRKLPQRHVQLLAAASQRELFAHGVEDLLRDGARLLLGLHGTAAVHQLHVQGDRVDGFDHADRQAVLARIAAAVVGGKYLCARLTAEEHDALIEDRKAAHRLAAGERLAAHAVEVCHVHRIVALVEGDLLDVHVGAQQLGAARAHAQGAVQSCLRAGRGIHPQVLHAVFVAAGVKDLARMDTNRFPDGGAALDRSRYHFVCHFITSWHQIEARFSNSVCVAVFDVIPFESALHKTLSAL